ncbi:MAG: nucH [Rhodoglobus sp.]|nr:nucH [Rhodoglobus sp.]
MLGGLVASGALAGALGFGALFAFQPRDGDTQSWSTDLPADAQPMVVWEVLSGDTVVLVVERPGRQVQDWGRITARLLGIDSPNFGTTDECYAVEAEARLTELLPEGSVVWLALDEEPRDDGGRWLSYLWTSDGRFVNYELAVDGFVEASPMPPNTARWKAIEAGQAAAVARLWGIWGECGH